jgi:hypothetical protein
MSPELSWSTSRPISRILSLTAANSSDDVSTCAHMPPAVTVTDSDEILISQTCVKLPNFELNFQLH